MDTHKRNFSLDALRGVAILLVLARHMPVEPTAGVSRAAFELGWTGVDLFFVLSGYLISTLLYKELDRAGALDLKRFWLRRGLKIWPSYFVCFGLTTVITAALSLSAGDAAVARKTLLTALPNVVFVQNYVGYQWPHTWSLAIEEHFYILFPLLLVGLGARGLKRLPAILLFVCVAVLALRTVLYTSGVERWQSFYYPTHARVDALAFGVLLGYLQRYKGRLFRRVAGLWPLLLMVSLPLVLVAVRFPLTSSAFAVTAGFTLIYLGYGALVIIAAAYPEAGWKLIAPRAAAWLGRYSYTIYLAHSALAFIPMFGPESRVDRVWTLRVLFWSLSIALGFALSHAVERPFLRYRERVLPARSRAYGS
jgi:peptidoglycan/LPS O-acetylase OafA/YrhL